MSKKKLTYSIEELENDPSLRYYSYHEYECLLSDEFGDIRFVRYLDDGSVRIADLASMRIMEGSVSRLSIRRRTGHSSPMTDADRRMVHESIVTSRKRMQK